MTRTILVGEVRTGRRIATIPVSGASFSTVLKGIGTVDATIPLTLALSLAGAITKPLVATTTYTDSTTGVISTQAAWLSAIPATVADFQANMTAIIQAAQISGNVLLWVPFATALPVEATIQTYRDVYPSLERSPVMASPVDGLNQGTSDQEFKARVMDRRF